MADSTFALSGHLVSRDVLAAWLGTEPRQPRGGNADDSPRGGRVWSGIDPALGPASSLRAMLDAGASPLCAALGFAAPRQIAHDAGRVLATVAGDGSAALLVVTTWGMPLSPLGRSAIRDACRRGLPWVLLFNGTHLRLMQSARGQSLRYCEIALDDLSLLDPRAQALTLLFGARAQSPGPDGRSRLDDIVDASDRHGIAVTAALRDGVRAGSLLVLRALLGHKPARLDAAFDQSLVIVYRLLFLLFAEARALVPVWHPVYRESYSLQPLCDNAAAGHVPGLWDAVRAICRLAHHGCQAGDLRVAPFNGRLFAPSRVPLAERRDLDDELARQALLALTTRRAVDGEGRCGIAYRDLGVEQLGAVYETLLDYQPRLEPVTPQAAAQTGSRRHGRGRVVRFTATLHAGGGRRKSTGSFYTPQPLADYLVRHTLEPLVRDASPDAILSLRVLDPAMGSGAFLVSACRFLADAYAAALVRTGGHHPADFGPAELAAIRRRIAERCLYGVDLNPMAVQLAQLSLWLATLAADRPLSFLDHHLTVGDSLIGAWTGSLRSAPNPKRAISATLPLFDDGGLDRAVGGALPVRVRLACEPNDTAAQVHEKERALAALHAAGHPLAQWRRVADIWCAAWFRRDLISPASFGALADAVLTGRGALPDATTARLLQEVDRAARERRFFHWELEFPEVFFDAQGVRLADAGFAAVVGNPPWDMVRADSAATRADEPAALVRFSRASGAYHAQSDGQANRYQMFVERSVALLGPGGRLGLIVPSGLATDQGSASLRRLLFSRCTLEALTGFENRRAIFPIHRSVRFLLLSARTGGTTERVPCRFGETDLEALDRHAAAPVVLTRTLLERVSGDSLAIPDIRSPQDLAILEQTTTRFAPIGAADSWQARFGRELNATEDRGHFTNGRGLPVIAGRQIAPFRVDVSASALRIPPARAAALLGARHQRARLAYRDVASATNRVTLIAALLPAGCVSTHTLFVLRTPLGLEAQSFLCALFNSLLLNYLARLRVTSHVTTAIVEQLPVPGRREAAGWYPALANAARKLRRGPDPRCSALLNARVARLYGLSRAQFEHVLGTFPLIPASERQMAVRAFADQESRNRETGFRAVT